jgi:hypothetical protein
MARDLDVAVKLAEIETILATLNVALNAAGTALAILDIDEKRATEEVSTIDQAVQEINAALTQMKV